jgi:hypothetical protein
MLFLGKDDLAHDVDRVLVVRASEAAPLHKQEKQRATEVPDARFPAQVRQPAEKGEQDPRVSERKDRRGAPGQAPCVQRCEGVARLLVCVPVRCGGRGGHGRMGGGRGGGGRGKRGSCASADAARSAAATAAAADGATAVSSASTAAVHTTHADRGRGRESRDEEINSEPREAHDGLAPILTLRLLGRHRKQAVGARMEMRKHLTQASRILHLR